eukprot:jgi/Chlat1/3969/Chrsp26S04219
MAAAAVASAGGDDGQGTKPQASEAQPQPQPVLPQYSSPPASSATPERVDKGPDAVKLFVGQLPKTMVERQIFELFQQCGQIADLSIIRDRATGVSRGCCFLTFTTKAAADQAIALFHNKHKVLPMSQAMQVKYADGELEKLEHKIFVGMLPKTATEDQIMELFRPFGRVLELSVLKGPQNVSRGCAFVKYETKEQAQSAISNMNGCRRIEGATSAIVVKWADTPREKEQRRMQKATEAAAAVVHPGPGFGQLNMGFPGYPYPAQSFPPFPFPQDFQMMVPQQLPSGAFTMVPASIPGVSSMPGMAQMSALSSQPGGMVSPGHGMLSPAHGMLSPGHAPNSPYNPYGTYPGMSPSAPAAVRVPQLEGPPGCNLFVYHLPAEFQDRDLTVTFSPFGNVISAKVYIDKVTGLSKCFGFVSFDSPASAQAAIQTMNGFTLGGKRLKVQLKRGGNADQTRPY